MANEVLHQACPRCGWTRPSAWGRSGTCPLSGTCPRCGWAPLSSVYIDPSTHELRLCPTCKKLNRVRISALKTYVPRCSNCHEPISPKFITAKAPESPKDARRSELISALERSDAMSGGEFEEFLEGLFEFCGVRIKASSRGCRPRRRPNLGRTRRYSGCRPGEKICGKCQQ